jgi:hypothetical protein
MPASAGGHLPAFQSTQFFKFIVSTSNQLQRYEKKLFVGRILSENPVRYKNLENYANIHIPFGSLRILLVC